MESASVSAVLFVKNLKNVAAFYSEALGMNCTVSDDHHSVLECRGFNLIIHQIPKHVADGIAIQQPPTRRAEAAIRLNFPVQNIGDARRLAGRLGGDIDAAPPEWADPSANVFLGCDPEGNVFNVSQHAC